MRIAIATDNGQVAQHFGRCMEYTLYDVKDKTINTKELVPNPGHAPGAIPKFLNEKGCQLIIAGGMGRRAQLFFEEFNIDWIIGVSGNVDEVITAYLDDRLEIGDSRCTHGESHGDGRHGHEHCTH